MVGVEGSPDLGDAWWTPCAECEVETDVGGEEVETFTPIERRPRRRALPAGKRSADVAERGA
eukprot:7669310-Pyramimonas_sp.AAC.1